jgi:hypothetical protein
LPGHGSRGSVGDRRRPRCLVDGVHLGPSRCLIHRRGDHQVGEKPDRSFPTFELRSYVRRRSMTGVTRPFAGLELCRGPFPMGASRSPPCRWSRDRGNDDPKHHELPVVSRRPMSVHHRLPTRPAAAYRRRVDPDGSDTQGIPKLGRVPGASEMSPIRELATRDECRHPPEAISEHHQRPRCGAERARPGFRPLDVVEGMMSA